MDLAFDEAIEAAKRLSPDTCDVVLSRGVTVDVVRQIPPYPSRAYRLLRMGSPAGAPAYAGMSATSRSFSTPPRYPVFPAWKKPLA